MLTEKPMSIGSADGQAMVDACAAAGVKLMVAYRIQYEPYNRRVMRFVPDRTFGGTLAYHGINTQTVASDGALHRGCPLSLGMGNRDNPGLNGIEWDKPRSTFRKSGLRRCRLDRPAMGIEWVARGGYVNRNGERPVWPPAALKNSEVALKTALRPDLLIWPEHDKALASVA